MKEVEEGRAIYMGELRKNTTSTGTITKKTGYFGKFETVGTYNRPDIQENFFMKYFFFIPL